MSVLAVGPGQPYATPCAAIAVAHVRDTIAVDARRGRPYRGDVCAWRTDRLTIRGVHGRARIEAAGAAAQGKAIWVIVGDHTTVADVELTGASVPDRNGAGIRLEGAGLRVLRSRFAGNEDGILTAANPRSDVVVERSTFERNGAGDGFSHNIYVGDVRSFTLRDSVSADARVGHLVKSRARRNRILRNRLSSEHGTSSYELDLPQGGDALVAGNRFVQGRRSQNPAIVAFAEESPVYPRSRLVLRANRFVDRLHAAHPILARAPVVRRANRGL